MNIQFSANSAYSSYAPSTEGRIGQYSMLASDARISRANDRFNDNMNRPVEEREPSRYQQYNSVASEIRGDNFSVRPADNVNPATEVSNARRSASNELLQSSNRISASYPSAEDRLSASADNSNIRVTDVNSAAQTGDSFNVQVTQTAAAQENNGRFFAQGAADFNEGANNLHIETNQGGFNININVREDETNASVINRTADTINRRDIGVTASAEANGGAVSLNIISNETGTANAFSVEQSAFSNRLGINEASTQARDAEYSVNGGDTQSSSSNSIYLGRGVTAEIEDEGEANVYVSQRDERNGTEADQRVNEREQPERAYTGFFEAAA